MYVICKHYTSANHVLKEEMESDRKRKREKKRVFQKGSYWFDNEE